MVALAALAHADPPPSEFLFVHVPNGANGGKPGDVAADLRIVLRELGDDFAHANGRRPKICVVGFTGPWSAGGPELPNVAGAAANELGNASATDDVVSIQCEIDYCTLGEALRDLHASQRCDIVLGLGEGTRREIELEVHGARGAGQVDCNGADVPNVCPGDACEGTDWDDPAARPRPPGLPPAQPWDRMQMVEEAFDRSEHRYGLVLDREGDAGRFLCGFFCCRARPCVGGQ